MPIQHTRLEFGDDVEKMASDIVAPLGKNAATGQRIVLLGTGECG